MGGTTDGRSGSIDSPASAGAPSAGLGPTADRATRVAGSDRRWDGAAPAATGTSRKAKALLQRAQEAPCGEECDYCGAAKSSVVFADRSGLKARQSGGG